MYYITIFFIYFFFSSRRRHTICALVTGVQTCALPIWPDNPALSIAAPGFDFNVPESVARMNAEITRQASMVSYIDAFWFLFIVSLAVAPMVLLMRRQRGTGDERTTMHLD